MSDPRDGIPRPISSEALTGPMSGANLPTIDEHIAAAETLKQHGDPTVAQTALGIALAKKGRYETEGKNWGPFVREVAAPFISATRLATYAPGGIRAGKLAWCAFFVCWAVLQALRAAGARADHIAIWMRLASGSCTTLHARLDKVGLVTRYAPDAPLPAGTFLVFYGQETEDGPDLDHVGIFDRVAGALLVDVSGNSGHEVDGVAEGRHMITDSKIHSTAILPF